MMSDQSGGRRWGLFSSKFLHKSVEGISVLFVSQSPTARLEHDEKKKTISNCAIAGLGRRGGMMQT